MVKSWPKLKNPPIVLAVFEVRFTLPPDWHVTMLKKNDSAILKEFPHRQDNFSGNINVPAPVIGVSTAHISTNQVGYTYINEKEGKRIVITRENMTFLRDGSYPGWETMRAEFEFIIKHYEPIFAEQTINRVAARVINKIKIKDIQQPQDYFTVGISAEEGVIAYPIDSYYYRYSMHIPEKPFKININHSIERQDEEGFDAVLDIDVLGFQSFPFAWDGISPILNDIRGYKNDIFFNNITDKTLALLT